MANNRRYCLVLGPGKPSCLSLQLREQSGHVLWQQLWERREEPLSGAEVVVFTSPPMDLQILIAKMFTSSILLCFLGIDSLPFVRWQYLALHTLLRSFGLTLNVIFAIEMIDLRHYLGSFWVQQKQAITELLFRGPSWSCSVGYPIPES